MSTDELKDPLDLGSSRLAVSSGRSSHLTRPALSSSDKKVRKESRKRSKPSKEKPLMNMEKIEPLRNRVYELIDVILKGEPLSRTYEACYKDVETLCTVKHIEQSQLADTLHGNMTSYFDEVTYPYIKVRLSSEDAVMTMDTLTTVYKEWSQKLMTMMKIFLYLDRSYLLHHPHKKTILEHGKALFSERFFSETRDLNVNVRDLTVEVERELSPSETPPPEEYARNFIAIANSISDVVAYSRVQILKNGIYARIHESLTKDTLTLITTLSTGTNRAVLERMLLSQTLKHYSKLCCGWETDYIPTVLAALSYEVTLFKNCGFPRVWYHELSEKLAFELLIRDLSHLLPGDLLDLVYRKRSKDILCMLKLSEKVGNSMSLSQKGIFILNWGKVVRTMFQELINDHRAPGVTSNNKLIPEIVMFIYEQSRFAKSFCPVPTTSTMRICDPEKDTELLDDVLFELRGSVSKVILDKDNNNFILVQLSKYCDNHLKTEVIKKAHEMFLEVLTEVLKVVPNKSDFITIYTKDMSRRLLLNRSRGIEYEKNVLDKIQEAVGENDDVIKLKGMFSDLEVSEKQYSKIPSINESFDVDFNALVLDKRNWPDVPKNDFAIKLPQRLQIIMDQFLDTFLKQDSKNKGKVLDWSSYNLHQIIMTARFKRGDKDLQINLLQAVVLLLFEEHNSLAFKTIANLTNIEDRLLRNVLSSFCSDRYRILVYDDTKSVYSYNDDFTDKSSKIRIPLSRDKGGSLERRSTTPSTMGSSLTADFEKISKDRNSEIRSTVVRIMKAEKRMVYSELMAKAISNIEKRAPVTIQDVKRNVESLITSEYIARQPDGQTLVYIP